MSAISDFINSYTNQGTIRNYRSGIQKFLSWKFNRPISGLKATKEERAHFEILSDEYINSSQHYSQDILAFISYCNLKNIPPKSTRNWVAITKEWLAHYEKDVNVSRIRKKLPKGGELDEKIPSIDDIKKIISHANFRTKLLILFLCSTGLRINECLSLRSEDLTEKDGIGIVTLKGKYSKTRNPRTVFLTPEVMELYKIWMNGERDTYLKNSEKRSGRFLKVKRKDTIFPFHDTTGSEMLETALKHAGMLQFHEENTIDGRRRKTIHFHIFRKWFITTCALNGMPDAVRYSIEGHQKTGMDQKYVKVFDEDKEKAFRALIPKLTILQDLELVENYTKIKTQYEQTDENVKLLMENLKKKDKQMQKLTEEISQLRSYQIVVKGLIEGQRRKKLGIKSERKAF